MRPLAILKRFQLVLAIATMIAAPAALGNALLLLTGGPSVSEPTPQQNIPATAAGCYNCELAHGCFAWRNHNGQIINTVFGKGSTVCPGNDVWDVDGEKGWVKLPPR